MYLPHLILKKYHLSRHYINGIKILLYRKLERITGTYLSHAAQ